MDQESNRKYLEGMEKEMKVPQLKDLERVLTSQGSEWDRWEWRIKGTFKWHHPSQPAVQYTNGDWTWYWMDQPHRWDGPALFWNGESKYWIHGQKLSREEWEKHPRRLEWLKTNKLGGI